MLLYCHWHLNNLKCILWVQVKLLLYLSLCNTEFCNWLLKNDTAGLMFQLLLSEITCIFKYNFGHELWLCTYVIFQVNLVINLIWQYLLNCVRCCQNYYLKGKIAELPYVARTTSINMRTFLFFVLKEHRLIEPCRLKVTFRGQLLLRVRPVTASWLWLGPVQLCAFGRIETLQTPRSACSQSFTTLMLIFFFLVSSQNFSLCLLPSVLQHCSSEKSLALALASLNPYIRYL